MNLKIVETKDGLHSLYVPELDEHYHSTHGALQEALHIFIGAGLDHVSESKKEIAVLEIGLGTALNAYLTLLRSKELGLKIQYHGLELYPVAPEIAAQLNYAITIGEGANHEEFVSLHKGDWSGSVKIGDFELLRIHQSVFEFNHPMQYDLIYFDAFGFRAQEEMWGAEVFQKMYDVLKPGGTLVTYSSKGEVRRRMQQAGFVVEKLAGPAFKREMVRAKKV